MSFTVGFGSSKAVVLSIDLIFDMDGRSRDMLVIVSVWVLIGGISTGLVVYHRPPECRDRSIAASVRPLAFSKLIDAVPLLLPTWLNVCISGLSIMYLSGERMVPVESGVWSMVQYITVLSVEIFLHWPTPMAWNDIPSPSSLLYVIIGIGVSSRR